LAPSRRHEGFLDDLRVEAVPAVETTLHKYLSSQKGELLAEVRKATKLTKELEEKLSAAIGEAKKLFLAEKPEAKQS